MSRWLDSKPHIPEPLHAQANFRTSKLISRKFSRNRAKDFARLAAILHHVADLPRCFEFGPLRQNRSGLFYARRQGRQRRFVRMLAPEMVKAPNREAAGAFFAIDPLARGDDAQAV